MSLGTGMLLTVGFALVAAIAIMLISGSAKDITLSLSEAENKNLIKQN